MANAADKEQIEMLSRWWNTYGKGIMIAIIVALLLAFGWRYWTQYKENNRAQASIVYQNLVSSLASKKHKEISATLIELKTKFSKTPYAELGALLAARSFAENQEYSEALKELDWVNDSGKVAYFQQLARLGMAQIFLEQKQFSRAEKILTRITDKTFQPLVDNLLGRIFVAQGEPAKAKVAFSKAKIEFQQAGLNTSLIDMELNAT